MGVSGICACGGIDHESYKIVASYMTSVFPTGNAIFSRTMFHVTRLKFYCSGFQKHNTEFHLMSWLLESPDLNLIEHIWGCDGTATQGSQTTMLWNILNLCDCCLNIWYNLSPAIYLRLHETAGCSCFARLL